jgi:hypothetical protein
MISMFFNYSRLTCRNFTSVYRFQEDLLWLHDKARCLTAPDTFADDY